MARTFSAMASISPHALRVSQARRHLHLGRRISPGARQDRGGVCRHRGAEPEKHRPPVARLPRRRVIGVKTTSSSGGSLGAPGQTVDRGAAVRQFERRAGAGIFRRWDGRGDHLFEPPFLGRSGSPAFAASSKVYAVNPRTPPSLTFSGFPGTITPELHRAASASSPSPPLVPRFSILAVVARIGSNR